MHEFRSAAVAVILYLAAGSARAEQPSLFRVQSAPQSTDSVSAFHTPELYSVIAREMGPALMRRAEADQQVSFPVQVINGIVVGHSCAPHACGADEVLWAVSRVGNVYVRLLHAIRVGNRMYPNKSSFGSAPMEINQIFDHTQ